MKEHAEFKGMDIRAVENPYEAAFELAKKINLTARSTRNWIIVLYSFFSFYVILSMAVIYANLMVFNQSDLKYLGVAMGLLNIGLGCYAEWLLARSYKSFAFIYKDQELLGKIDGIGTGTFDGTVDAGGSVPPFHAQGLLDRLLKTMENDSEKLFKTSRIVLSFILLWMLNAVIYYSIQIYRFGLDIVGWKLDWLPPGGLGIDTFLFLAVCLMAYRMIRNRLGFLSARYKAIVYALNQPRAKVPAGGGLLERYKTYLASLAEYRGPSDWKPAGYFNGMLRTGPGKVLVKALDGTPDSDALADFIRHARAQGPGIRHAVLLFPEDLDKTLQDAVYDEVVNNPVRAGNELFTVELVMEGQDGFYDFIPVVSP